MKSYDEIAKNALEKRDRHNEIVSRRKKIILRAGVPMLTFCLAVMIGVGYSEYGKLNDGPEIVDDAVVTGIDDLVDPDETGSDETEAYQHLTDTYPSADTETVVDVNPVPGGAEIVTEPAIITEVQGKDEPVPGGAENGTEATVTRPVIITGTLNDVPSGGDAEDGKNYAECPPLSDEIWIEPHWAEKALYTKYPEFEIGGKKYITGATWIDSDKLGGEIGSTTAYGYDVYEEKSYEMKIRLYEINGIGTDAALAVSYNGFDGQYAVYCNHWYTPATLGEFINVLNLKENLTFGTIYYTTFEYESYMTVEYKIGDPAVIFELLRDNAGSENVADHVSDYEMSFHKNAMSLSVSVDILGIKNVSLAVSENGYVKTNIMGSAKLFYIGEDKTTAFMDYVKENFETVRELSATTTAAEPYEPGEDIVVTAVTETSKAYIPDVIPE